MAVCRSADRPPGCSDITPPSAIADGDSATLPGARNHVRPICRRRGLSEASCSTFFPLTLFMNRIILSATISIPALLVAREAAAQNAAPPHFHLQLEETVVTASPFGRTLFEQAQPVSVLKGDKLRLALQPTLGETLSGTPGVTSSYFGPASSRPIIRGLDADRVRILQNGTNTIDASAASVDHAVSFDPVSVESIEVVRGPATLLYGPNAVGGVVNVLDNRVPDERIPVPVRGSIDGRYGSVNTERAGSFMLEGGAGNFAWHIEGYTRAADELHIPGFARSEQLRLAQPLPEGEVEARNVLPNSDLRTQGLSGGASYIWDSGYFGLAYSGFHSNYGTVAEPDVTIDLEQRRWDFRGAFMSPFPYIKSIKYNVGVSDYEHTEFEGTEPGTVFENEGYDGRIEIAHEKLGPFDGTIGFQTQRSDFSAIGEESFLPVTRTLSQSVFLFEEAVFDPLRFQFGLRYDHVSVDADEDPNFGPARGRTFDNFSASAGVIWTPSDGYAVALNTAYTERAATFQELYANGPHIATNSFDVGDPNLDSEKSFSVDLSLRKKTGRVTGSIGIFYNHFNGYIGQFADGTTADVDGELLPVFNYRATDADFFGGEAEVSFHLLEPVEAAPPADGKGAVLPPRPRHALHLDLKADYVHATDTISDTPLPRIPPFRASAALNYEGERLSAGIEGQFVARQNRVADFETATDSYFLLNANIGYRIPMGRTEASLYVKGVNLTNAEARVHSSFLKDIAPLGGRGVLCGMRFTF